MSKSTEYSSEDIHAFVLGTLDLQTAARLRAEAEGNPQLAAEIALWTAVRRHLSDSPANAPVDELGWARLNRALAEREAQAAAAVANDNPAAGHRPLWRRHIIAPWQAAAGIAVAVMAWQFAVVPTMNAVPAEQPSAYELAGEAPPVAHTVRVAFAPDATERELSTVLRAARARVVDGPSAVGLYTLGFADPEAKAHGKEVLAARTQIVAEVTD